MNQIAGKQKELKEVAAEDIAAALSHWQVMDIVHVFRNGSLRVLPDHLCSPLQRLVDANILKRSDVIALNPVLIASYRFRPVYEALRRSGRISSPEQVA